MSSRVVITSENNPTVEVSVKRDLQALARATRTLRTATPTVQQADTITSNGLFFQEGFTPSVGQTLFTLSQAPDAESVQFKVNGVDYRLTVDYTVSGSQVTWLDTPFTLDTDDRVVITYLDPNAQVGGGGSLYFPPGWT